MLLPGSHANLQLAIQEYWIELFKEGDYDRYLYMLGNLTLLEANKNSKEAGIKNFEEKKKYIAQASMQLQKKLMRMNGHPTQLNTDKHIWQRSHQEFGQFKYESKATTA